MGRTIGEKKITKEMSFLCFFNDFLMNKVKPFFVSALMVQRLNSATACKTEKKCFIPFLTSLAMAVR